MLSRGPYNASPSEFGGVRRMRLQPSGYLDVIEDGAES